MSEVATKTCARCGHSSDEHAFNDSYEQDPDPSTGIDFGPTHCHALGHAPDDCTNTVCTCSDFVDYRNVCHHTVEEGCTGHGDF